MHYPIENVWLHLWGKCCIKNYFYSHFEWITENRYLKWEFIHEIRWNRTDFHKTHEIFAKFKFNFRKEEIFSLLPLGPNELKFFYVALTCVCERWKKQKNPFCTTWVCVSEPAYIKTGNFYRLHRRRKKVWQKCNFKWILSEINWQN